VLNIIFTIYGAAIIALIHLVIFAGAISVMLLVTIVITGEASLSIGDIKNYVLVIIFTLPISVFLGLNIARELRAPSGMIPSEELLEFVWTYRPWDLLILIIILAASMVTALNLLSRRSEAE
jgi:NADH:ubiquinone oxidoreductase subunit 6 (subunit J)